MRAIAAQPLEAKVRLLEAEQNPKLIIKLFAYYTLDECCIINIISQCSANRATKARNIIDAFIKSNLKANIMHGLL